MANKKGTLIACELNDLMRSIHNRMPVILTLENYDPWLDPKNEDVDELAKLLVPFPEQEMAACPVSTLVNNPKFDAPRSIEPVKYALRDLILFARCTSCPGCAP